MIDLGNNINDGICEINNKILKCNFNHNYYGEQNLRITFKKPFWEEDYLDVKILIENVYDEPILDESKLNENGRVEKDLLVDETQTYDLRDYVIEIDTQILTQNLTQNLLVLAHIFVLILVIK